MRNILIVLNILLVVAVIVIVAIFYWPKINLSSGDYYAVYLETGDLYFGKLSRFPYLCLTNVWYLQKNQQSTDVSLVEFTKSIWGPEDKIKINPDKVVWTAKLSPQSEVWKAINSPTKTD